MNSAMDGAEDRRDWNGGGLEGESLTPTSSHRESAESDLGGGENGRFGSVPPDGNSTSSDEVITRKSSMLKMRRSPNPSSSVMTASDLSAARKKTVSFSSTPLEKSRTIINAPDCLHYMKQGSELVKVRANGRQYKRTYFLDSNMVEVRWSPSSKKKNKARVLLEDMKEVRSGKNTEVLRNAGDSVAGFQEECAFSILYGNEFHSLDLLASSPDEASIWVTGLMCLIAKRGPLGSDSIEDRQLMRDRWLQEVFSEADYENKGFLEEGGVINLMKALNSGVATTRIRQKLKEAEVNPGHLSREEFVNLFKEISTRPEIYFLLVRYSSTGDFMSADDLLLFLEAEQRLPRVTKEHCLQIIELHEPSAEGRVTGQLGIDGFTSYLLSMECDIFDLEHATICQDMTQPLPHYFIASSHNTYLMADQLKGPSSVEGYIRALRSGCRFLELDCWDGPNDDPIIYHGNTLTSKISFRSVIQAISANAFCASDYPLILSLEDHCSPKQQRVMASILLSELSSHLLLEEISEEMDQLPSPHQLRGKVIIKGKKLPRELSNQEGYVTEEDDTVECQRERKGCEKRNSLKKRRLVRELSDLVNLCQSVRFDDFQTSQKKQRPFEISSLSESSSIRLASSFSEDFVNHNKRVLTRVYPNATRVDSSNFNPQDLWNCGCQIVALNYQTDGLMMDLNTGFFNRNGRSGYVLKPAVMREQLSFFSLHVKDGIPDVLPQTLHVRIISGQQLPKPAGSAAKGNVIDPYVVIELFGIPADCAEERTKTVPGNGYNPIFDESFEFQVNLTELALVRFIVLDDESIGDEFIGQYTIPFECIQTGYRHIRLKNNHGEEMSNSYLFVHIAITNKRGGTDKLSRKGNSSSFKRRQRRKLYPTLKKIGFVQVDDVFKLVTGPLKEAADLRLNLQESLILFREVCGLSAICNVKQCIRSLAGRVAGSQPLSPLPPSMNDHHHHQQQPGSPSSGSLSMLAVEGYPKLQSVGCIPDPMRKAVQSFDELINDSKLLIKNGESLHERLLQSQRSGMEFYESLSDMCDSNNLKARKAARITENFTWNIRLLMGQADLLQRARQEALDCVSQSMEAGRATGLLPQHGNTASVGPEPCLARREWQARADEETGFV